MTGIGRDIRYSVVSALQSPGWVAVAVCALGLGIGANTAVFSVVNAVFFRPLPYPHPQQLVVLWGYNRAKGFRNRLFAAPDYRDLASQNQVFEQIGAYRVQSAALAAKAEPERVQSAEVTPGILELLGAKASAGRLFAPDEDQPGKNAVAVLSDGLYRRLFSANPQILGTTLRLDDRTYTIVGIAPADFALPDSPADLWVPYTPEAADLAPSRRGFRFLTVLARLKPGTTIARADVDVWAITSRIADQFPDTNRGYSADVVPLREQLVGGSRPGLWALMGAVGFVLLISCANVANLLLARASERQKEFAVRASLGATPRRIIQQLLTESLLLALAGGFLGLILAVAASSFLARLAPAGLVSLRGVSIDWRVLAFTLGVCVATAVLFGLAPAAAAAGIDLNATLRSSGRGSSGTRARTSARDVLICWEVASCTVLLIGAGLSIRGLDRLEQVNPGFRIDDVLTMQISPVPGRYPGSKIAEFYRQILDRALAVPGVREAGLCNLLPLAGQDLSVNFQLDGATDLASADQPRAKLRAASAGYFAALGVPLLRGRVFNRFDTEASAKVVVINQAAARIYWPNQDPVGKRIFSLDDRGGYQIVGIVGNVKHSGLDAQTSPEIYYPYLQIPADAIQSIEPTMTLVIRTSAESNALAAAIRRQIRQLDPDQPVFNVRTMGAVVQSSLAQPRYRAVFMGIFAGLALLLAVVGLYGVVARSVTQRTNEVGIRLALGATPAQILGLILGRTAALALIGIVAGLAAALLLAKAVSSLILGLDPHDPLTLAVACSLMLGVALLASLFPALRITHVDPSIALKAE
jgi:putative ABC transport system permease protein